jgi:hypothetical protein
MWEPFDRWKAVGGRAFPPTRSFRSHDIRAIQLGVLMQQKAFSSRVEHEEFRSCFSAAGRSRNDNVCRESLASVSEKSGIREKTYSKSIGIFCACVGVVL